MVLRFSRFFHSLPFSALPGKKASVLKYEKVTGLVYVGKVPEGSLVPEDLPVEFCVVEETPGAKIGYRTLHGESFPAIQFKTQFIGEYLVEGYPTSRGLEVGTVSGLIGVSCLKIDSLISESYIYPFFPISPFTLCYQQYAFAFIVPFLTVATLNSAFMSHVRRQKRGFIDQIAKSLVDVRSREILEEFRKAL